MRLRSPPRNRGVVVTQTALVILLLMSQDLQNYFISQDLQNFFMSQDLQNLQRVTVSVRDFSSFVWWKDFLHPNNNIITLRDKYGRCRNWVRFEKITKKKKCHKIK